MKLIKQSVEIIEQKPGLEGIYEMIEMAGRTCYKSERKEGTTAKDFVDRMIASGHGAMLEHGTVYLYLTPNAILVEGKHLRYNTNPYSKYIQDGLGACVTTNYRVLVENDWLDDLQYLCEPTEYHKKRHTVKFITDIGVGRELTRHRTMSFAQESTRYCNYSKDRFNNEITFIIPSWVKENMSPIEATKYVFFKGGLQESETCYLMMLKAVAKPEEARAVLPLATKSELVMTGFESDWAKVFDLRVKGTTGKPHPDMIALMEPVMNEFINRGWYGNNK